ncbi:hypothetical protein GJ629_11885 [Halapricum sp. CBA1109]|uniref:CheF family chemotaxis protein n=1 Tax=Halapricum sp. CBA1109 TaxID=2668068 RepID=UPI0012F82F11|nr:CheF family chemotaxis protein [Halapricum sp. CBA1109]MUV90513.1 hypothetical protein [Halapricum sp. CBA1109]
MPSVLADFAGNVSVDSREWDPFVEGRIILGEDRLVLAADEDDKLTVPLSAVFDITVGSLPTAFDPMPGTPVVVAFEADGRRQAAAVSGEEATIEKFVTVLFKAILNGTSVTLKHPAKVGGRVMDTDFRGSLLNLQSGGVVFDTEEGPLEIPLDGIIDFGRETRAVDGTERPVLVVSHVDGGEALTTVAAVDSARKLSILGRYLRRTYDRIRESISQLTLSEAETETLTTLYSAGDVGLSLSSVLDSDPSRVKKLLHSLHSKGLIESEDGGPVLTAKGQIVVTQYLERVNE